MGWSRGPFEMARVVLGGGGWGWLWGGFDRLNHRYTLFGG